MYGIGRWEKRPSFRLLCLLCLMITGLTQALVREVTEITWSLITGNNTSKKKKKVRAYSHRISGFKYIFQQEAKKAFKAKQSRLMLNSIITKIEYNKEGVAVYTKAGDVVHADYAISTFS